MRSASLLLATAVVALFAAAPAGAAERRDFKEVFGSGAQPAFTHDEALAVDPTSGDLFVIDVGVSEPSLKTLGRFGPTGEPVPFSALGTNAIDGKLGPGGKPCGEEPASCDKTPDNEIVGFTVDPREVQVAVAPPGSAGGTAGNIYVTNASKHVIDVFAPSGEYIGRLTEFQEGPAADGPLTALGETCGVAVDSAGTVFVSDFGGEIHVFAPSASPPLNTDNSANLSAVGPCTIAAGAGATAGFLFVTNWGSGDLTKLDASTGEVKYLLGTGHVTVAVDPQTGHVLAAKGAQVEEYDASGGSEAVVLEPIEAGSTVEGVAAYGDGVVANNRVYVSRAGTLNVDVYGPFLTPRPTIRDAHADSVSFAEAVLKAEINPRGSPTTFRVDYGLDASYGNSTAEIEVGSDNAFHQVSVRLSGLTPRTTFHWRIVATSEDGGPSGEDEDHVLVTYGAFVPEAGCANRAFRTAASAFLPDCRAYEMVSPVDKNGGDIEGRGEANAGDPGGYMQASADGGRITYTSTSSFAGAPSSFKFNQYLASREEGSGWSNQGIYIRVTGHIDSGLKRNFMAFTPDLCSAWMTDVQTPPVLAGAQDGYINLYRRDNCGAQAGELEVLTDVAPPAGASSAYVEQNSVQGVSEDSRHAVFVARAPLTPDAHVGDNAQIYDRVGGVLKVVSVLPSGAVDDADGAVGSGKRGNTDDALSADGSHVYWTSSVNNGGEGQIYLRRHPGQGIVADECSEAARACTLAVSATGNAFFWDAAPDGSKALYTEGEDLYRYDEASDSSQLIAAGVRGVAGTSDDLSRIYFVSLAAVPGSGQNSEGDEAVAGQPNLFLEEEGATSFVGTLVVGDAGTLEPGAVVFAYNVMSREPNQRATRVTPDGTRIVFNSRAPLTDFDQTDAEGKAAVEVFSYEAGGALHCISCSPGRARPQSREMTTPYIAGIDPTHVHAAAWIPTWEHSLHATNVLSEDGNRIFFNSHDALLPRDTNGAMDVYEWEAPGAGSCDTEDGDYFALNGGCIYLISSGESPGESEFWEASPDGADVFFTTESSLLPQDPGSIDLYDARVGGGFPQPTTKAPCEGEACQSPPPPPSETTPASAAYQGPGNVSPAPGRRCPKGKRKVRRRGKVRCVKRRRHQAPRRQADRNRRNAR